MKTPFISLLSLCTLIGCTTATTDHAQNDDPKISLTYEVPHASTVNGKADGERLYSVSVIADDIQLAILPYKREHVYHLSFPVPEKHRKDSLDGHLRYFITKDSSKRDYEVVIEATMGEEKQIHRYAYGDVVNTDTIFVFKQAINNRSQIKWTTKVSITPQHPLPNDSTKTNRPLATDSLPCQKHIFLDSWDFGIYSSTK